MSTENAVGCLFCLSRSLCLQLQQNTMVPVVVDGQISHFCSQGFVIREQILVNKSEKSDHPHQREPWCFVEVVNKSEHERKTSSPQHSRCSYASGELIRINFHPKTAKKMAPHCMARLDLVNCTFCNYIFHKHSDEPNAAQRLQF